MTKAYAALSKDSQLAPLPIQRRALRPKDVKIKISYCGVCHSDLHTARNEWMKTTYPCVPGHEIVGIVESVGSDVKRFKIADRVAVGCMVDSCHSCPSCQKNLEQYCTRGAVFTYNGVDAIDGTTTYGGYSSEIVVNDDFVLNIPKEFTDADLVGVAPLLCAGITTYSPLRHWHVDSKSKVGVVGIGGLGHMAIKLAHAMGAHVVVFTSNPSKINEAKRLGADEVYSSKGPKNFESLKGSLDFIIDTVAAAHELDPFIELLNIDGVLCLVGAPASPHPSPAVQNLIFGRRSIAGSLIGGIKETQELLDFCAKHHILADIELIPMANVNTAYERMLKGDVKYRFVIDMSTL
jgi:uncharacterized zinc-type alcohol dehydrogenase-like protein